jgi:hypothetical protein
VRDGDECIEPVSTAEIRYLDHVLDVVRAATLPRRNSNDGQLLA